MNYPFRSAAFGGFNRQDVLDYLEDSARDSAEKQAALTRQLEDARTTLSGLKEELSQLRTRFDALTRENQDLTARLSEAETSSHSQLGQLQSDLQETRTLCTQQSEELETLRKENQELREKVAWMEPEATAYSIVKVRTANIEMEAHRRAQLIENQSRQEADSLRSQVSQEAEQLRQKTLQEAEALRQAAQEEDRTTRQQLADWLNGTRDQYFQLCAQMKSALDQAGEQLSRATGDLTDAAALVELQRQTLAALPQTDAAGPEPADSGV